MVILSEDILRLTPNLLNFTASYTTHTNKVHSVMMRAIRCMISEEKGPCGHGSENANNLHSMVQPNIRLKIITTGHGVLFS